MTSQVSLRRVVARVAPVTIAVQACSFASSIALATYLGASYQTDAYYLALSIPVLTYGILLGGIRVGAIPALNDESRRNDERAFASACSELMAGVVLGAACLAIAAVIITFCFLPLLSAHTDPRTISLARSLVLVLTPLTILGAAVGALGAIHTVRRSYVAPAAVLACEPIVKIALMATLGSSLGAYALALGNLIGAGAAVAILWALLERSGFPVRLRLPHRSPFIKSIFSVSTPLLVANLVLLANPVVDRIMATPLQAGSITVLELGERMFGVSTMLLATSLIAPVTATWAARFSDSGWDALENSAFQAIRFSLYVVLPMVALGVVLSQEVVTFAYLGGEYGKESVAQTSDVFAYFMLGLPATIFVVVFASIFVVKKNAWVPMRIAFINVALNLVLDFVFRAWLGVAGLALATTAVTTALCFAYVWSVNHYYGGLHLMKLVPVAARVGIAAVAAAMVAFAVTNALGAPASRLSALGIGAAASCVGTVVYVMVLATVGELPMLVSIYSRVRRQR